MSFCRRSPSSVHILKLSRRPNALRSPRAPPTLSPSVYDAGSFLRLRGGIHTQIKLNNTTSSTFFVPSLHILKRSIASSINKEKYAVYEAGETSLTNDEYEWRRTQDPSLVSNLPTALYLSVVRRALRSKDVEQAESVIADILDTYCGPANEQNIMLQEIMLRDISLLRNPIIIRVLDHLHHSSSDGLNFLKNRVSKDQWLLLRLAQLVSHNSIETDRFLLRIVYLPLLGRIVARRCPRFPAATYRPPDLIYTAFVVVQRLLELSFDGHALDIFQALVTSGFVPTVALHGTNNPYKDGKLIISAALIRASIYWNWRNLAGRLMSHLLQSPSPDKNIIELNVDVIYALLDTPSSRDIRTCGALIRLVHGHSPVSASIIRQYYNSAANTNATREAESLYAFTRSQPVREVHRYPPPHGAALSFLMLHLTTKSPQPWLARVLAGEVVEYDLHLPTLFRAQFISAAAMQGYETFARTLWERYAAGREGEVVAGNAALMLRMTSLFWNVRSRAEEKCQDPLRTEREAIQEIKALADDAAQFVDRVMAAFKFHHDPLANAPHRELTSFARACFIVGKIPEGYSVLRLLLDRNEVPDLYDANVALSALAKLNPRLAANLIGRMVELGLQPDATSFGTVLYFAVKQGKRDVVDTMIEHLRGLNSQRMSLKTLANLINSSLDLREAEQAHIIESQEGLRMKLGYIQHLIESFPEVNIAASSQLTKTLVYAALRAQDGRFAYKFWKSFLHRGAEWSDEEQRAIRKRIAWLIRQDDFPAAAEEKSMMLTTLGLGTEQS